MAQKVIYSREVDVDPADECGVEGDRFQLDDDVAAQLEVVEKKIEVVVAACELEMDLPADEREAAAELEQEALNLIDQGLLDLTLPPRIGGAEEVEEVRVLEDLLGHVGIVRRQ